MGVGGILTTGNRRDAKQEIRGGRVGEQISDSNDKISWQISELYLGLHFGSKKPRKLSIVFEESRNSVFFRTEVKP